MFSLSTLGVTALGLCLHCRQLERFATLSKRIAVHWSVKFVARLAPYEKASTYTGARLSGRCFVASVRLHDVVVVYFAVCFDYDPSRVTRRMPYYRVGARPLNRKAGDLRYLSKTSPPVE